MNTCSCKHSAHGSDKSNNLQKTETNRNQASTSTKNSLPVSQSKDFEVSLARISKKKRKNAKSQSAKTSNTEVPPKPPDPSDIPITSDSILSISPSTSDVSSLFSYSCLSFLVASPIFESEFAETSLPPKQSSLSNEAISDEDYEYAKKIWDVFGMHTLGDFHDLYVISDVLLLEDVFENFRKVCLDYYKFDPCHIYTAPRLAWQECLRKSGV
ncbi:hypothetical protein HNY73_010949 [Argiope bruennichi]|uniref:DNA-directed DNA polymerase n=1 Tax=Argiope bruennichi TaxID=94029 RepID=A0A8T0F2L5_ARGBR|nr:hypothetical protein HNY73_010949 [Argiope bruennichi]